MGQLSIEKRGCCGINLYHKDIYSRKKKKKVSQAVGLKTLQGFKVLPIAVLQTGA